MEYRNAKSRLWLIALLLAVIALVSWSLNGNSQISELESKLVCVSAKRGEIEQGADSQALIIRDEMVYISPASGTLRLVAPEKGKVRTDTVIAQVVPGENQGRTEDNKGVRLVPERPGIVSFTVDGLERILTPSSWVDFDNKKVSQLASNPVTSRSGMQVETGQALFRVIDNYCIYALVFLAPDITPSVCGALSEGNRCALRFDSVPGRLCYAKVASRVGSTRDNSKPSALLLELADFPYELYYVRQVKTRIITRIQRGIIIPKQALVKGKDGCLVYIPANLGVDSKPVTVIAGNESHVMCEGLREGQRVVVNPYVVHEAGMTIWR